jgi:serine/threonine protein phosphatase 1
MSRRDLFAVLRRTVRVWAVAAVHGQAAQLHALHRALWPRLLPGDRLVYLGNLLGRGAAVRDAVDLVLEFRRHLIARPGFFAGDLACLRGSQEEMWDKLLQLQFAPNPREVLDWMLAQGLGATLEAYGAAPEEAMRQARGGAVGLARWTGSLRRAIQAAPGHADFLSALRRAAYTGDGRLLFVHAGIDPERPLTAQNDALWWGHPGGFPPAATFDGFARVVRGFDRAHAGVQVFPHGTSIDGGCGFGGPLIAACFGAEGAIDDLIET